MTEIVVVGAGIVGASVAYHAARRGAAVTIVDQAGPASGVTRNSFAWIGASGVGPGPAAEIRRAALQDYRRLEAELPDLRVRWTGSLSWQDANDAAVPDSAEVEPAPRVVDAAEIAVLEPNLRQPPPFAVFRPTDGAVDPVAVTEALVGAAGRHGASVVSGPAVTSVCTKAGRVLGVDTSAGFLPAATVVLAAGVDVPRLCAPLGVRIPVTASPTGLVRLTAAPGLVKTLVATPTFEVREAVEGHLLAAVAVEKAASANDVSATARRTAAALRAAFRGADRIQVENLHVGWRPMPQDGEPILGPAPGIPGLYLAVMHSAVTLAPVIGRLVADELVDGPDATSSVELRECRLTRFPSP